MTSWKGATIAFYRDLKVESKINSKLILPNYFMKGANWIRKS